MRIIPVVAAQIWQNDQFLICQRTEGKARAGTWEFPGGKIEDGETPEQALIRECQEELAITIQTGQKLAQVQHRYEDITIDLQLYKAHIQTGEPVAHDHAQLAWITSEEMRGYELSSADAKLWELLASER